MRIRYYSSALGRFMTPDPWAHSAVPTGPQSWNRYTYVTGEPITRSDPTGLACIITDNGLPADDGTGGGCPEAGVGLNGTITPLTVNVYGDGDLSMSYSISFPLDTINYGFSFDSGAIAQQVTPSVQNSLQNSQKRCLDSFNNSALGFVVDQLSALNAFTGAGVPEWTILPLAKWLAAEAIKDLSNAIGSNEFLSITGAYTSATVQGALVDIVEAVEFAGAGLSSVLVPAATAVDAGVRQLCSQVPGLTFFAQ